MNSNHICQVRETILGFLITVPRGIASAALLAFIASGAAQASSITYDLVTLTATDGDTLTGSITTDGDIGILPATDITAFSFTQAGSISFNYSGTTNLLCDAANDCGITATATSLSFDFTNSTQNNWIEFCTNGSYPCVEFGDAYFFGDIYGNVTGTAYYPYGTDDYQQPAIQIATVAPVPLPAAAWLLLSGLGGLGGLGVISRKRKPV